MGGLIAGALLLVLLQALVTDRGSSQFAGFTGTLSNLANAFMSPAKPAIPDLRKAP